MNALTLVPLAKPIDAEVTIPGSKSYTLRALLLAAITSNPVRIQSPLFSDDTEAMIRCLQTLGIETEVGPDWIDVKGYLSDVPNTTTTLDADLSAASIRFLIALACVVPGVQILHGKEGLNKRPVKDLVDALREMGADIEYLNRDGYPPVKINSNQLNAGIVWVSGATSSQYTSAILMIAPAVDGDVTVEITGELISKPYLEMTLSIMEAFGVTVRRDGEQTLTLSQDQRYAATSYIVEADASSAAYFLAMAALTQSRIKLKNLNPLSAQADMQFIEILSRMGNHIIKDDHSVTIEGHGVRALDVDMRDCPDQAQTLAVLAAFAPGATKITGLQSLRVKETDRIAAVQQELAKMGIQTDAKHDELIIHGGQPQAAHINTYGDHRMAMSFAVAGTALSDVIIHDPRVVGKTFPTFWDTLHDAGIQLKMPLPEKIVLIGFMGAGKSELAPALAKSLNRTHVDMDTQVIELSGRHSISEIFEQDGERHFRELELRVAKSLQDSLQVVISAGGGIVMDKLAMDYLRDNGLTILLEAELETVLSRLGTDTTRPLLQDKSKIPDLFALRAPLYEHYADLRIATDAKSPVQTLDETLAALHKHCGFQKGQS